MANGLLSPVEKQTQSVFGMVPMEERLSLLPRYSKTQGLIAPQFIYELAKAVSTPIVAMRGDYVSPEETLNVPLSGFAGSALGTAPKGALLTGIPKEKAGLLNPNPNAFSYRGSHKAPSPEFGAPLYDLTGGGQMYPADVYSPKAVQYYGTGYPKADREAFSLAQKVKGNPEAEVTMYRAVPKDDKIKTINSGDWVTLSKEYAKTHGESALNNNYKIIEQKVKAKDLWTNADSIHEFGYWPQK